MTDEELICSGCGEYVGSHISDRIEALTAKVKLMDDLDVINGEKIEALTAKLAKAVEGLRYYAVEAMPWEADDSLIARTTLAEIEGEKT